MQLAISNYTSGKIVKEKKKNYWSINTHNTLLMKEKIGMDNYVTFLFSLWNKE